MNRRLAFILTVLSLPSAAFAQDEPAHAKNLIGPAVRVEPEYEGSDKSRTKPIPILDYTSGAFFARSTQGILETGARYKVLNNLSIGAQAAFEPGRKAGDSDFLKSRNFEDIDAGASVGVFAEGTYKLGPVPLTGLIRYRQNSDSALGAQVDMQAEAGVFGNQRVRVAVFGRLTYANDKAMQSYFGITPSQSVRSGLPAYEAKAGLRSASFGAKALVTLSQSWSAIIILEAQQLQGKAKDSPIVRDSNGVKGTIGLAYRF